VTNSSYGLIFVKIRAKYGRIFSKNTGENTGKIHVVVILSSFCDLVHVQSVIDLFANQLNNAFNLHKITKIRVKSQKYGRNTGDFAKMPVYTGMPV